MNQAIPLFALACLTALPSFAQLRLPAIIGDHMVIQQQLEAPIWGWDKRGTGIAVSFAGRVYRAQAGDQGKWMVRLAPQPANATPQELTIQGSDKREVKDVLIGDVWLCAGQSNMAFPLRGTFNGDLEAAGANFPGIRRVNVPCVGTQEARSDFDGQWQVATPASVGDFSAVGYLFCRNIHQVAGVPIGLIQTTWAGSPIEAWICREDLEKSEEMRLLIAGLKQVEADTISGKRQSEYQRQLERWRTNSENARKNKKPVPPKPKSPEEWMAGNARPGNIFGGMMSPILGFGIKGVAWYQGENNSAHGAEYARFFPFLIEHWRQRWGQGTFPFFWVQLPNFEPPAGSPAFGKWAELRDAQSRTLKLPKTGQAVTIDLGDPTNAHPRNKAEVAMRLARWALATEYAVAIPYRSPELESCKAEGNKVVVAFDCFGSRLTALRAVEVKGFQVSGSDGKWHDATGRVIAPAQVEVTSSAVSHPIRVSYAWADNPDSNLYSTDGLPATPFRADVVAGRP